MNPDCTCYVCRLKRLVFYNVPKIVLAMMIIHGIAIVSGMVFLFYENEKVGMKLIITGVVFSTIAAVIAVGSLLILEIFLIDRSNKD